MHRAVKTQLTERSGITDNIHVEKTTFKKSRTLKTRKKVMRMPVMKSVGVFVQQSNDKVLAARCPFFSGRVMLWRRFRRLCWESDLRGNSSYTKVADKTFKTVPHKMFVCDHTETSIHHQYNDVVIIGCDDIAETCWVQWQWYPESVLTERDPADMSSLCDD